MDVHREGIPPCTRRHAAASGKGWDRARARDANSKQMARGLILCVLLLALAAAKTTRWFELEKYDFAKYKAEFARSYRAEEEVMRKKIFAEKLAVIKAHNRDPSKTWKMGVNQFTDRTEDEFRKVLGVKRGMLYSEQQQHTVAAPAAAGPPLRRSVDWRTENVISTVKDQVCSFVCCGSASASPPLSRVSGPVRQLLVLFGHGDSGELLGPCHGTAAGAERAVCAGLHCQCAGEGSRVLCFRHSIRFPLGSTAAALAAARAPPSPWRCRR